MSIEDKKYRELIRSEHKIRFKIGDKVKLMWKQRSKYKWFWEEDGLPCLLEREGLTKKFSQDLIPIFPKLLGTGTITEVFEIEMEKEQFKGFYIKIGDRYFSSGKLGDSINLSGLILRDGFATQESFFSWFDKNYDLSSPRKFCVYRWEWD